MSKQIILAVSFAFLLSTAIAIAAHDQTTEDTSILPIDHKAIQYATGPLNDPVTKLDRDLEPDASGMPAFNLGMPVTDDRTSFQDRWGGWYVTGTHGGMHHRGNAVARDRSKPDVLEWQGTRI